MVKRRIIVGGATEKTGSGSLSKSLIPVLLLKEPQALGESGSRMEAGSTPSKGPSRRWDRRIARGSRGAVEDGGSLTFPLF
jgi:hypothetical protein